MRPKYITPILEFNGFTAISPDDMVDITVSAEPIHILRQRFTIMLPSSTLLTKTFDVDGVIQSRINEWKKTPKAQYLYTCACEPVAIRSEICDSTLMPYDDMYNVELEFKLRERHYLEYILTFQ